MSPVGPKLRPITPTPVVVKLTCRVRGGCAGTVALLRGTAVVGRRAVKVRYGTTKVKIALRPHATIARTKRLRVRAPRGLRARL